MTSCPVCKSQAHLYNTAADSSRFDCSRCGEFDVSGSLGPGIEKRLDSGIHRRALMSHNLRRMQRPKSPPPLITTANADSFWKGEKLPSPQRQADDLILWVGDNQLYPDEAIRCALPFLSAWVGTSLNAVTPHGGGIHWLCTYLADEKLLEARPDPSEAIYFFRLRMEGWRKYSELKQKNPTSQTAFMAMKFGDSELTNVVDNCFRSAVSRAGFELKVLSEEQPAGIIDDQLRAALISSRFVLCDLTHGNSGAYWEGGFAEGLGRPVIYTCQRAAWDQQKTHFDTNHLVTIIWDSADLPSAENQLTATIRATFRGEAKQADA